MPHYPEALPHLALSAILQRVVNGGGRVHRELAAGRGAMDLLVAQGPDRFAIEVKRVRRRDRLETVVDRGVAPLGRSLDTLGQERGWLIVFDVRPNRTWEDRLWTEHRTAGGKPVVVLGACARPQAVWAAGSAGCAWDAQESPVLASFIVSCPV